MPYLLVGGLGVLIQRDLAFGEAQLGAAVAAFFAGAALAAAPAGRVLERLGPRATARIGISCIVVSLIGIALVAGSWASLVALLALGGIGHQATLLGANLLLARSVNPERLGLAFGTAQAAIPLMALLAGLSVPALGLTVGWRWAFLMGAGMAALAALTIPAGAPRMPASTRRRTVDAPISAMIVLAAATGLAAAGAACTAAFLVASSVDRGLDPGAAGLVLATASAVGLGVRVAVGWLVDRLAHGSMVLMAVLLLIGAVGYLGLAGTGHPTLMVVSAVLAFGGGWGWPGLLMVAVFQSNPVGTGAAMGVVSTGGALGHMLGPVVFGVVAEHSAFTDAWLLVAAAAIAAAGAVLASRHMIQRAENASAATA